MPAKKRKETDKEKALKQLILKMVKELGDSKLRPFFSQMTANGITTDEILMALGIDSVLPEALTPGTWVKLYWYDTDPTWCLLLESPNKTEGRETSLKVFDPQSESVHSHPTLSQVIDYETTLIAPDR